MNRRSFLLGLAMVPVAGIAIVTPIVVSKADRIKQFYFGIPIGEVNRNSLVPVNKRDGMSPLGNKRMLKWEI